MVEWMKIQQELTAKGPSAKLRKIGFDELATHNTLGDVWMAINGTLNCFQYYNE